MIEVQSHVPIEQIVLERMKLPINVPIKPKDPIKLKEADQIYQRA